MSAKYAFIGAEKANYPVSKMCGWLSVSRSGYYEWASREDSAAEKRRGFLRLLITRAFEDSHGTYGHRRVWAQLARWGVQAGLELVRRLMRELGMVPCQPRPWRATTSATAAFTCRLAVQRASRLNRPGWRRLMQTYGPLVGQPYFVT